MADEQTSLFLEDGAPASPVHDDIAALAARLSPSLLLGTSSWTYPGWTGLIYAKPYRKTGTSAAMLREYARYPLFRTVGVDSFFYTPPSQATLRGYADALPTDFRCVMKVWDRITSFAKASPRNRAAQGELNSDWLNAALFQQAVLDPTMQHFGDHAGPFVFEFEAIATSARMTATRFADQLDQFFRQLPRGPEYAVEIRNESFLAPVYFDVLREHNVAHLFNSWTRMPSIGEQLSHDSMTADFAVCRALLRPGRTYSDAVDKFSPYDRLQEEAPEVRADLLQLVHTAARDQRRLYVVVNNRLEGSAPMTLQWLARTLLNEQPRH